MRKGTQRLLSGVLLISICGLLAFGLWRRGWLLPSLIAAPHSAAKGRHGPKASKGTKKSRHGGHKSAAKLRQVAVFEIEAQRRPVQFLQSGRVLARDAVTVGALRGGAVSELSLERGDPVKKGQVILRLVDDDVALSIAEGRARVSRAKVVLEQNRREETRAVTLEKRGVGTSLEAALARDKKRLAEADLAIAEQSLRRSLRDQRDAVLIAPFDGVVVERKTAPGSWVNRGASVLEMVGLKRVTIQVGLTGPRVLRLKAAMQEGGLNLRIRAPELGADEWTELVMLERPRIAPVGDVAGMFPVEFTVKNQRGLLPGMVLPEVRIDTGLVDRGIFVPRNAVLGVDDIPMVMVLDAKGQARQRKITLDFRGTGSLRVLDGLKQGDKVITVGHENLRDGQAVLVRSARGKAPARLAPKGATSAAPTEAQSAAPQSQPGSTSSEKRTAAAEQSR